MPQRSSRVRDPQRLLELLWEPPAPSSRTGISTADVTRAGVELADADGLDAVTLRAVADRLGVGTMSLYTYVPAKPELLELMLDAVAHETYADHRLPGSQSTWQYGIRRIAEANWDAAMRHPWRAELVDSRSVIGPGVMAKYDSELAPLNGIGLDDIGMDLTLSNVLGMVTAAARDQLGLNRVREATGLSDQEWWQQVSPLLQRLMAGSTFPLADRVGTASSISYEGVAAPRRALDFGVETLIMGVEQRIS